VTEELRTLLRAELGEERPPPLGDLVDVAIRDGRRIRRVRRLGLAGAGAAVLGVVALTASLGWGAAAPPPAGIAAAAPSARGGLGPRVVPSAATVSPSSSPFPVMIAGPPVAGPTAKATGGAMLVLLTKLLPPGKTSNFAVAKGEDTHVQLYLDTGKGPGMIRASLEKDFTDRPASPHQASVTVDRLPDNCVQSIVVDAALPNGANLAIDIGTCLAWDGKRNRPAPAAITADEAVKVATDPRWGLTMDAQLVKAGAKMFPDLPTMR
jgi:hypothetical protein